MCRDDLKDIYYAVRGGIFLVYLIARGLPFLQELDVLEPSKQP